MEDLDRQLAGELDNPARMERLIHAELLRDDGKHHDPFFSTRRSYFHLRGHGSATETVLAEQQDRWV